MSLEALTDGLEILFKTICVKKYQKLDAPVKVNEGSNHILPSLTLLHCK